MGLTGTTNGLLLINKPPGLTSHDVVGQVRRAIKQREVGHTGTLDPMATGLMILVLGEATKLSDFLTFADKSYRVKARLGVTTDTLDTTGTVLSKTAVDLPLERITEQALALQGEFEWPIPLFSAAKVDGKKLYEYGREGQSIELPRKVMHFSDVTVHDVEPDAVSVSLRCSKGSFIRSWCAELGKALGVGGCMEALERLTVGPYSLDQAITLPQLTADPEGALLKVVSMADALPGLRSVRIPSKEERLLLNGQIPRDLANRLIIEQKEAFRRNEPIGIKVMSISGQLISILMAQPGNGLKIRRVFRLDRATSSPS